MKNKSGSVCDKKLLHHHEKGTEFDARTITELVGIVKTTQCERVQKTHQQECIFPHVAQFSSNDQKK